MDIPKQLPDFFQYAIHILFAVVIGISFENSSDIIIPIEEIHQKFVNAGILILGYFIIITSWIGYYLSIRKNPHKNNRLGYIRFILDIFTIYIFYYIINLAKIENQKYQDDIFLYLLPLTFFVYLAWDIVKYFEYKKKSQTKEERHDRIFRIRITVDYLILFIIIAIFYYIFIENIELKFLSKEYIQIFFIGLAALFIYKYREAKYVDTKRITTKQRMRRKNSQKVNESN